MASTESGRPMYPSFKEAHEAFVAEYTALYQGFPKYLRRSCDRFRLGGRRLGATVVHYFGQSARFATLDLS